MQSRGIHAIFCKSREAASKEHWRSSASELLIAYPLIRHFAEQVVSVHFPALREHVESLCLCFRVVDVLQDIKGGTLSTALLQHAIVQQLRKRIAVYGNAAWKPKYHYTLHAPQQIDRDKILTDTFVVERSHILPKLCAIEIRNTASFEKSAMARVLLHRLEHLESFDERPGLLGKDVAMCPELCQAIGGEHAVLASQARLDGIHVHRGDFLLVDGYTFELSAVCKSDDHFFLLGRLLDIVRHLSPSSALWRKQSDLHMLSCTGQRIRRCHAWAEQVDGTWLTLHSVLE